MSDFYKCIRPRYVRDFQCDGKACGSKCCGDWRITIDPETLGKYKNMEPKEAGQEILSHIIYRKQYKSFGISLQKDYRCPFLDTDHLCRIQKRYGEDYISDICATYPRVFYQAGDIIEESLAMTCSVAAKKILFSESPIRFEEVELPYPRKTQIINWEKHVENYPDCWRRIQETCIKILQDRNLTMNQRMLRLLLLMEKLDHEKAEDIPKWLELEETGDFSRLEIPEYSFSAEKHISHMAGLFSNLYKMEMTEEKLNALKGIYLGNMHMVLSVIWAKYGMQIENYMVNEFFLRFYPFAYIGSFMRNIKLFVTGWKLAELSLFLTVVSNHGSLEEEQFMQVLDRIAERLDHSRDGMVFIWDSLLDEPIEQSVAEFAEYMLYM